MGSTPGRAVSVGVPLLLVRAMKTPSNLMLKMAQFGESFMSTPRPTCWLGWPPKVALNSSARPEP